MNGAEEQWICECGDPTCVYVANLATALENLDRMINPEECGESKQVGCGT